VFGVVTEIIVLDRCRITVECSDRFCERVNELFGASRIHELVPKVESDSIADDWSDMQTADAVQVRRDILQLLCSTLNLAKKLIPLQLMFIIAKLLRMNLRSGKRIH
jgi:hypothetical protein